MNQKHKLTKIFLLVLYSVVILCASIFIVELTSKSKRFEEYQTIPYNEDLLLSVQMMEVRQSKEEVGAGHNHDEGEEHEEFEYSKFDTYVYVSKNPKADKMTISNMYSYICVETADGKFGYSESSSGKSMSETTYTIGTMSMLNSSTAYSYNKVVIENDKTTHENRTPKYVYVKVAYDVKYAGESSDQIKHKEINYRFEYKDMNVNEFDSFENRTIGSSYVNGNDLIQIKLAKTTNTENTVDTFKLYKINVNNQLLEKEEKNGVMSDETIKSSSIKVYALSTSDEANEKYFPKYIKLFTITGTLNTDPARQMSSIRQVNLNKDYKVEKLYVSIEAELSSGRKVSYQYYVNVDELPKN